MPPMGNVGNAFTLPFKSADWFPRLLLMGLMILIPIIGWMNLTGWMLATLDNYRRGVVELPPAGFQYIGRGAALFAVQLVYGIILGIIFVVPLFAFNVVSLTAANAGNPYGAGGFNSGFTGFAQLVQLGEFIFFPSVVILTDRHGFAGGLNVPAVWRMAATNWKFSLLAAVLLWASSIAGSLGIAVCCVGILVSYPYSLAVNAGIVRYFEATFEPPQQVPQAY